MGYCGDDLIQRLILRDQFQDGLPILLQSFRLAGGAGGGFGGRARFLRVGPACSSLP